MDAQLWIRSLFSGLIVLTWGCSGSYTAHQPPQVIQNEPGPSENRREPVEQEEEEVVPETFELVVIDGKGGGFYPFGDTINIEAQVKDGKRFDQWVGPDTDLLEDPSQERQSLKMPSRQVMLKAEFLDKLPPHISKSPERYLWKPKSDGGAKGTLVILYELKIDDIAVYDENRKQIEKAYYAGYNHNGYRLHYYRFRRTGSSFPTPSIVRFAEKEFLVPDPGQRYERFK